MKTDKATQWNRFILIVGLVFILYGIHNLIN